MGAPGSAIDFAGDQWSGDQPWQDGAAWGWESWGNAYANVADDLASRGYTATPVRKTARPELYRTYRYGRQDLKYHFRTAPGRYIIRLHFTEPWFGVGGGLHCRSWRMFDVRVNEQTVARDLDIWTVCGGDHYALVRDYPVETQSDLLTVDFPFVRSNQALICGIEVFAL